MKNLIDSLLVIFNTFKMAFGQCGLTVSSDNPANEDVMRTSTSKVKAVLLVAVLMMFFSCEIKKEKQKGNESIINEVMDKEKEYIRMAIEVAKDSKRKGNLPFGCVLVNKQGEVVLEAGNTIHTDSNCIAHSEINLIQDACQKFDHAYLNECTIYTSDEPCPMCSSAIYWSGIGRLVYGLSKTRYYAIVGRENPNWVFEMPARELLKNGGRKIEVVGPLLEDEVALLHLMP